MNDAPKKLYRSRTDRIIAGVCGGLGEFFNIDPVLFRIVFIVLLFTGGSGFLIYLVMMLIIPKENEGAGIDLNKEKVKETLKESAENIKREAEEMKHRMNRSEGRSGKTGKLFALFLIAVGLVAFLHEIFPMPWFRMNFIGPLVVMFIGFLILFRN